MKLTIATSKDLPRIQLLYQNVIQSMYKNNVFIWDDYYPYQIIKNDITNQTFYIVEQNNELIGGFALNSEHKASNSMKWHEKNAPVLYLDRFGIHSDYTNQGIATKVLNEIIKIVKQKNIHYLRLFVVQSNLPAIQFYCKNNFLKAQGIYGEQMNTGNVLYENAYEKVIKID